MRKLVLLAAIVVIAALLYLLSRALGSHGSVATLPPELSPQAKPASTSALDAKRGPDVDRTPAELADPTHRESTTDSANAGSLRIRVTFANQPNHKPDELQVRVSDLLGVQRDAHRESPTDFVVPVLALGEYVVLAEERWAIPAAVHAKVTERGREALVEIALAAKTSLSVHWKSTDGTPIVDAIAAHLEDDLHRSLVVYASRAPIAESGPLPASLAIASRSQEFDVGFDSTGERHVLQGYGDLAKVEGRPSGRGNDFFGSLDVPAEPPFFVSAWSCGALIETQSVAVGQRAVVFTTTLEQVKPSTVPVKFCVVDDDTGQPRRDVYVWTRGDSKERELNEDEVLSGWHELDVEQGQVTLHIDWRNESDSGTDLPGFAPITRELRLSKGHPLDLGLIGVSRARKATYRVVNESGKPVEGAEFALVNLSSYDGSAEHGELRRVWSNPEGLLEFTGLTHERYAITCSSPRIDATPFVIDGSRIAPGDERIIRDIVVRPVRQISLVFDDPPRVGTLMMIETPDGLPVRTFEMDEFGIVPLWLGGTDYRVHLIEDGVPTASVPFRVTSDPCVLRIQR
jgi:hypothetical protein